MKHDKILLSGIVLIALLGASPLKADPIDKARHPQPDKVQTVHQANHEVDQAWEVYHRAALGGTVASLPCRPKSSSTCMKPGLSSPRRMRQLSGETSVRCSVS